MGAGAEPVALVSYWTYARLARARLPLPADEALGPVHVLRFKKPVDPLAGDSAGTGTGTGTGAAGAQSARVIHAPEVGPPVNGGAGAGAGAGEAPADGNEEEAAEEETVTLRWTKGIPHEHVVFLQYDRIKDWESWSVPIWFFIRLFGGADWCGCKGSILVSTARAKTSSVTDPIGPVQYVSFSFSFVSRSDVYFGF